MLVLFETSVGYAIFKVLNEKKLQEVDSLWKEFETPEKANKMVHVLARETKQEITLPRRGNDHTAVPSLFFRNLGYAHMHTKREIEITGSGLQQWLTMWEFSHGTITPSAGPKPLYF